MVLLFYAQITGVLINTGHSVLFRVDTNTTLVYDDSRLAINITGGPLSYRYRFEEMHIHYGLHDQYGSEHSVQGYTFPAEVATHTYTHTIYNSKPNFNLYYVNN